MVEYLWAGIPTSQLLAELERRQDDPKPVCGSGQKGAYNTTAHVFALILILTVSTIGCGFPLVTKRSAKHAGTQAFVFISQHFGTGVLIATAFVHLLPTAFSSLTDPCLPWIWNEGYMPMPGLIAMTSVLMVVGIEQFLRSRGAGHSHSHGESWNPVATEEEHAHGGANGTASIPKRLGKSRQGKLGVNHRPNNIALEDMEFSEGLVDGASPLPESTPVRNDNPTYERHDDDDSDLDLDELDPTADPNNDLEMIEHNLEDSSDKDQQKKLLLQCLLLEAGILFHSVFIGMAISVATGTPFVIFLIAISFHQTFEGLALGSRIAAIKFPRSSPRPWLMVLAYGLTTPIGQAIGLGVHTMYDPRSQTGLLMVGIMNAISSGLLLFAGLVQLLAEDFLSDKSYGVLTGKRRLHAYLAVIAGAALMALVGAWA